MKPSLIALSILAIALLPGIQDARAEAPPPAAPLPVATTPPDSAAKTIIDEDPPPRLSLPTESERALWEKPGFRLMRGRAYGELFGLDGAPSGRLVGPIIRLGVRLDETWSLLGSFEYLYASASGGLSGIRYAGTIEPTWHATERFSLAVGLGFGGIVEGGNARAEPNPQPSTLDASYTFPNAKTPISSCTGVGMTGLVRGDYLYVLGPRSSTGLSAEVNGQWTGCVADTGRVEPDSASAIVRRQWWPHVGLSLAWMFAWR
jgi:hypothetical protein